jgi:hypothetical protein
MMYYLDCACQIQVDAMAAGMDNVLRMSDHAAKTAAAQFNRPNRPALTKSWPALLRLLDRRNISFRD